MIAKEYRLNEQEVKWCLRQKNTFSTLNWMVRIARNRCGHCRFGVILSAKVSHTSVKRNRFRRKLYDLAHNHTLGTADILCIPRKGVILSEDASAFLDEIKILLKKSQTFVFHPSDRPLPVRKILPKKTSPLSPL